VYLLSRLPAYRRDIAQTGLPATRKAAKQDSRKRFERDAWHSDRSAGCGRRARAAKRCAFERRLRDARGINLVELRAPVVTTKPARDRTIVASRRFELLASGALVAHAQRPGSINAPAVF